MSQQAHYFKIGLFVVGATELAVIGIIVLGAGKWFQRSTMVETYFFRIGPGARGRCTLTPRCSRRSGRVHTIGQRGIPYFFDPKTDSSPTVDFLLRMSVRPSVAAHIREEDEAELIKTGRRPPGFGSAWPRRGSPECSISSRSFLTRTVSADPNRLDAKNPLYSLGTEHHYRAGCRFAVDHQKIGAGGYLDKIAKNLDTMITSVTRLVNDVQGEQSQWKSNGSLENCAVPWCGGCWAARISRR